MLTHNPPKNPDYCFIFLTRFESIPIVRRDPSVWVAFSLYLKLFHYTIHQNISSGYRKATMRISNSPGTYIGYTTEVSPPIDDNYICKVQQSLEDKSMVQGDGTGCFRSVFQISSMFELRAYTNRAVVSLLATSFTLRFWPFPGLADS